MTWLPYLRDHLRRIWLFCILLLNPQAPCQVLLIFKKRRQNLILSNYSLLKLIEFANRITIHLRYKNVEVLNEGLKKYKKLWIFCKKVGGQFLPPKVQFLLLNLQIYENKLIQNTIQYSTIQNTEVSGIPTKCLSLLSLTHIVYQENYQSYSIL